ncbi:MAG: SymE family type I addiction module toxin [Candidatus Omnitrophota bacterium]|mgnify:CR=1 FL=1
MSYLTLQQLERYSQMEGRGKTLALISRIKDLEKRRQGKSLKVFAFPQNTKYVPAIRVSGLWLLHFGFELGDEVTLTAKDNEIIIKKTIERR